MRDVEPVTLAMVVGMGRGETITDLVIEQACEQAGMRCIGAVGATGPVVSQLALYGVPEVLRDDAIMLALVGFVLVGDAPDVDRVGEKTVKHAAGEGDATDGLAVGIGPELAADALPVEVVLEVADAITVEVQPVD